MSAVSLQARRITTGRVVKPFLVSSILNDTIMAQYYSDALTSAQTGLYNKANEQLTNIITICDRKRYTSTQYYALAYYGRGISIFHSMASMKGLPVETLHQLATECIADLALFRSLAKSYPHILSSIEYVESERVLDLVWDMLFEA